MITRYGIYERVLSLDQSEVSTGGSLGLDQAFEHTSSVG